MKSGIMKLQLNSWKDLTLVVLTTRYGLKPIKYKEPFIWEYLIGPVGKLAVGSQAIAHVEGFLYVKIWSTKQNYNFISQATIILVPWPPCWTC